MNHSLLMLVFIGLLSAGIAFYGNRTWEVYQRGVPAVDTSGLSVEDVGETVVRLRSATFALAPVDLDEVLDNALFEPARSRPQPEPVEEPEPQPEPAPVVEEAPEPQPLDIVILGIVLQGDTGFLVVRSKRGGRPEQITLGDTIEGWTLVRLSEMVAVFDRDGEEARLNLALR